MFLRKCRINSILNEIKLIIASDDDTETNVQHWLFYLYEPASLAVADSTSWNTKPSGQIDVIAEIYNLL